MNTDMSEELICSRTLEQLQENLGKEHAFQLLKKYMTSIAQMVEKSLHDLEGEDYEALRAECHKIKSSVSYAGALRLAQLCQNIEDFAKKQQFEEIKKMKEHYIQTSNDTMSKLNEYLESA